MKRILTVFLAFAITLGCAFLTSCNNDTSANSSAEETSVEESKEPETVKLKIGTYNIANGRNVGHDFKILAQDIIDNDLDIVGLQEVDKFASRSKFCDTMELLKEYTGMEYYAYFVCINIGGDQEKYGKPGEYGTAILSKYPITKTEEVELNDGSQVERRLLTYAEIDVNGTKINFFNTHLTVADAAIRIDEMAIVADKVKDVKNLILTGDFNVAGFEEFEPLKPHSYVNNPETDIITYPENQRRIDNIVYSSEFTLVEDSVDIFDAEHSDHVLLYAELEFTVENNK